MTELLNFISGLGATMGALGTAPAYKYPARNDRAEDLRRLSGDVTVVGRDLTKKTKKALVEANGKVYNRAVDR